jgi:hypothetical protein
LNEFTPPHSDGRDPKAIAASIARQFADRAKAAAKAAKARE